MEETLLPITKPVKRFTGDNYYLPIGVVFTKKSVSQKTSEPSPVCF